MMVLIVVFSDENCNFKLLFQNIKIVKKRNTFYQAIIKKKDINKQIIALYVLSGP